LAHFSNDYRVFDIFVIGYLLKTAAFGFYLYSVLPLHKHSIYLLSKGVRPSRSGIDSKQLNFS